ncbi:MAG: sulfatase-like hydrolase/transferase, partial [Phycisphaerae bacterium]|nr:sulfatase-like hydrolase/transferase [Phycisphaerae bacterium]
MGVFVLVAGAAHASAAQEPVARRPNVLLYVVDDQGMNDAGCYGNPVIRTPGLDTLASEGTRFTHAFCTTASCSPSRSVILTGLHTHTNGQYGLAHASHHFSSHANLKTLPV